VPENGASDERLTVGVASKPFEKIKSILRTDSEPGEL
jgi:hypothetical protein